MYIVGGKIITMTGEEYTDGVIHIQNGKAIIQDNRKKKEVMFCNIAKRNI